MFDIAFDNGWRATISEDGRAELYTDLNEHTGSGVLGTPEGFEPPKYCPHNKIVQDGDECEPLTVRAIAMVDQKIVYICVRDSDGDVISVLESEASDYVRIE